MSSAPAENSIRKSIGALLGIVSRVRKDIRGSALPMIVASLIPLVGIVGSAVDVSRAYLVKTRLQQACDAGALAARRAMNGETLNDESRGQGNAFFNANIGQGVYGARDITFTLNSVKRTNPTVIGVTGAARANVPTSLMRVFGMTTMSMSANCGAEANIINTDVMFVLDLTDAQNGIYIPGLKAALKSFYTTVGGVMASSGARFRLGFLPYSTNMKIGGLLQPAGAMRTGQYTYHSREVAGYDPFLINNGSGTEFINNVLTQTDCNAWANNNGNNPVVEGNPPYTETKYTTYSYVSWSSISKRCTRKYSYVIYLYQKKWRHLPISYNLDQFVAGNVVQNPTELTPTMSWDGCIEERLEGQDDIHMLPSSNNTRWAPTMPEVVLRKSVQPLKTDESGAYWVRALIVPNRWDYDCPVNPVMPLDGYPQEQVDAYVDSLTRSPAGAGETAHDSAMVWAGRLMSTRGLFASTVNSAPGNGQPVQRHIILMTDGQVSYNKDAYSIFGMEEYDKRILNNPDYPGSDRTEKFKFRFAKACAAAKADNVSVWVIAFNVSLGDPLYQPLVDCATPGQAFQATNADEINARFQFIASRMARMKLVN